MLKNPVVIVISLLIGVTGLYVYMTYYHIPEGVTLQSDGAFIDIFGFWVSLIGGLLGIISTIVGVVERIIDKRKERNT